MRAVLFALCVLTVRPALAEDARAVFDRVSPSVVTIEVLDETARVEGSGSGVVIARGQVVTNCHVVQDARQIRVRQGVSVYDAVWRLADLERDLCVLEVAKLQALGVEKRMTKDVAAGERVFAIGNPLGLGLSVSEGLVVAVTKAQDAVRVLTSAPISPGSSGGGLFDEQGRLLGITTSSLSLGQNLNIALPTDWIAELATRGKAPPVQTALPPEEPRWAAEADRLRLAQDWAGLERFALRWEAAFRRASNALSMLGLAQSNLGKFKDAEVNLRAALNIRPTDAAAWGYLAFVQHQTGRVAEAEESLKQAIRVNPSSGYPYQVMARWRAEDKKFEEAKKLIDESVRLTPSDQASWFIKGFIEENLFKPQEAARSYRTLLRIDPAFKDASTSLARALAASGQSDKAREVITRGATETPSSAASWYAVGVSELAKLRYTDAENALRKAVELDPKLGDAWRLLSGIQGRSGRLADAETSLGKALEANPADVPSLVMLGQLRYGKADYKGSLEAFERATKSGADNMDAWRGLGVVKMQQLDFRAAVEAYRHATSLPGVKAGDWIQLGGALSRQKLFTDAEAAFRKAEQMEPDNPGVAQGLAYVYGTLGKPALALEYLDKVLVRDPNDASALSGKGFALFQLGRFDEAEKILQTAVSLNPDEVPGLINYGRVLMQKKQLGRAIQQFERAIKLAPRAMDATLYLAQCYVLSNQLNQGRTHAEKVIAMTGEMPAALSLLTFINLSENKSSEALATYQRFKRKDPAAAEVFRKGAIAQGLQGASLLPE